MPPVAGLNAPNARMAVKEICDARRLQMEYTHGHVEGPPHAPSYTMRLVVRGPRTGAVVVETADVQGNTKKAAQEAAAAAALPQL